MTSRHDPTERQLTSKRKAGRPPKGSAPSLPYEELDQLLVHGEMVDCEDGVHQTRVYPTYRELAARYGVAHSLIAQYSKKHHCLHRRQEARLRFERKVEEKLEELRAETVALERADTLRIIDTYLLSFEQALKEGRVRTDNPGDFNAMVRLREFVCGGADSRAEVHTTVSLEQLQARHRKVLQRRQQVSGAATGMLIDITPDATDTSAAEPETSEDAIAVERVTDEDKKTKEINCTAFNFSEALVSSADDAVGPLTALPPGSHEGA